MKDASTAELKNVPDQVRLATVRLRLAEQRLRRAQDEVKKATESLRSLQNSPNRLEHGVEAMSPPATVSGSAVAKRQVAGALAQRTGFCPVCSKSLPLNRHGNLSAHNQSKGTLCDGVGHRPLARIPKRAARPASRSKSGGGGGDGIRIPGMIIGRQLNVRRGHRRR